MKFTALCFAFVVVASVNVADAGLFGRHHRGYCAPEPTCCAPAPSCVAPACAAPAVANDCAPAVDPSCCAPAVAPDCCAPAVAVDPNCCAPAVNPAHCCPAPNDCCEPSCGRRSLRLVGWFKGLKGRCHLRHRDCCEAPVNCCGPNVNPGCGAPLGACN